jgi:hypothetical protein
VRGYARAFAKRIAPKERAGLEDAVRAGYRVALARPPSDVELADSLVFVKQQAATYPEDGRGLALADFCQALACLNEFVYVE